LRFTCVDIFIPKGERKIGNQRQGIAKLGNLIDYSTHATTILPKPNLTCYHYLPKKEIQAHMANPNEEVR
jgi:hypothetical protein